MPKVINRCKYTLLKTGDKSFLIVPINEAREALRRGAMITASLVDGDRVYLDEQDVGDFYAFIEVKDVDVDVVEDDEFEPDALPLFEEGLLVEVE